MRQFVLVLLALLVPALVGGLNARRLQAICASASSDFDADGDSAPQHEQDQTGTPQLPLFAARASVTLRAAGHHSVRLPPSPVRVSRPAPMRLAAQPSTPSAPLRC